MLGRRRQPVQSRCYAWERAPNAFVDDRDCPYVTPPNRPFVWVRTRMLGGRVAVPGHGRQYYRLGPDDLVPNDGLSTPWPLQPYELDPWYSLVEDRLGLSGMCDGLPWLPDSELVNVLSPTPSEAALQQRIKARWAHARPISGRYAPPLGSIKAAGRTGRLQCRQGAIVREIKVDNFGQVCGVVWVDDRTRSRREVIRPASVPLCILLGIDSLVDAFPFVAATATTSGVGRYLMDHVCVNAEGLGASNDRAWPQVEGRWGYLPRFDARASLFPEPRRGYGLQIFKFPIGGSQFYFTVASFAEMLPQVGKSSNT